MSLWAGLAITIALLLGNALFVASEFALVSARRAAIEPLAERGRWSARMAIRAMEQVSLAMAGAQLGITLCTLGLGAVSEPVIAHTIEPIFVTVGIPEFLVHPIALVLATVLVVWCHVVLAEMVPKNIALAGPDRAALILGPFMLVVIFLLRPFVVTLNAIANAAVRLFRVEPKDEVGSAFTHEEVTGLVDESRREGLLDADEYGLVSGALEFEQHTVGQVMLPLDGLLTVSPETTPAEIERLCAETGFSRYPMLRDGEVVGYLHVKDVLGADEPDRQVPEHRFRSLITVAPDTRLHRALRTLQGHGVHLARVAGPDGATLGLVALEDILEELVGTISG
ncbi:hemolysin family protein [Microlunatus parietis]|uniref:CBS domain containing-hemolysin-like protein n=1 Tax=Microlunatus parietis TaxID=682979 RepID=A0A7Y9I4U0_9ACTN|nr:hemolysin family protein [Microlunatus parietis]NYE70301.1 CBS domain containing-hemolysin-like protein [Microlunatus parietis]